MYTYLKKDLRGHYLELEEQLPADQYENVGTTTAEDYKNNLWVKLSEEQLAWKAENPSATPVEVINMAFNPKTLQQKQSEKRSQVQNYVSQNSNNFTLNGNKLWLNSTQRIQKRDEVSRAIELGKESVTIGEESIEPKLVNHILDKMVTYDQSQSQAINGKYQEINQATEENIDAVATEGFLPEPIAIQNKDLQEADTEEDKNSVNRQILKLLTKQVNTLELQDQEALSVKLIYPVWGSKDLPMGTQVSVGFKFQYPKGTLYKVLQAHALQSDWVPGTGTESLYVRIDEEHEGTLKDPIPYDGNMILENGKYYTQNGKTYKCIRDTGIAVYDDLATLATVQGGQYVEEVV